MKAPENMAEYSHLSVFDEEKYKAIRNDEIEIQRVGDIVLTKEEEKVLKRNPKFAVVQNLEEHTIKEELEKAFSIVRMELRDKDDEELTEEKTEKEEQEEEERESKEREEMARTRQVYDPVAKTYDE